MQESVITFSAMIPTDQHALELVESGKQRLDNALFRQPLIERITIVNKIPDQSFGSSHGDGCSERSIDKEGEIKAGRSRATRYWGCRKLPVAWR